MEFDLLNHLIDVLVVNLDRDLISAIQYQLVPGKTSRNPLLEEKKIFRILADTRAGYKKDNGGPFVNFTNLTGLPG